MFSQSVRQVHYFPFCNFTGVQSTLDVYDVTKELFSINIKLENIAERRNMLLRTRENLSPCKISQNLTFSEQRN